MAGRRHRLRRSVRGSRGLGNMAGYRLVNRGCSRDVNGGCGGLVHRGGDWGGRDVDGGRRLITTVSDVRPAGLWESILALVLEEWVAAACCYVMMILQPSDVGGCKVRSLVQKNQLLGRRMKRKRTTDFPRRCCCVDPRNRRVGNALRKCRTARGSPHRPNNRAP